MKTLLFNLLLLLTPSAFAADCGAHLKAATVWEDEIDGQIVAKHSVFALNDWDPNAEFDVVLFTAEGSRANKSPVLEVEYRSKSQKKRKLETFKSVKAFELDPSIKMFEDFKPHDFFTFKEAGTYTIRLKEGNQLLCTESHAYNIGH